MARVGLVVVVLDLAVAVLVFPVQQTGFLPGGHPIIAGIVFDLIRPKPLRASGTVGPHHVGDVQAGHCANRRSGQIQQRDEHQRPTGGPACVSNFRGTVKEAHDDVGQTRGPDHQGQGEQHHVERIGVVQRVLLEADLGHDRVQLGQQGLTACRR